MPERRTTPMILHLDRQVVAVDKPAGLLSQPDRSHDPCVIDLLRELLVAALPPKADRGPATPFLASVHRLDRPVSGVLLVARTSKAAARLATQFRNHEVVKRYLAVASGTPSFDHSRAVVWLRKVKEENRVECRPEPFPDAVQAATDVTVIARRGDVSLLRLLPEQGRSHQLRATLGFLGLPIVGDLRYGSSVPLGHYLMLHAAELTFRHPATNAPLTVAAPLPDPWIQRYPWLASFL